jgi:chemotaxis protein MotB
MSSQKNIIIKQVKKKVGGGHHGGSWKVAYADFVTGMMAFFLLMWLITMAGAGAKSGVAEYFTHFSILDSGATAGGSIAIMDTSGGDVPPPALPKEETPDEEEADPGGVTPEQLQEKLRAEIQVKLKGLEDQILVEVFPGGVRIQLVDKDGQPLFPLGGSEPTAVGKRMLETVAGSIKDVPNKIAIEGHTDALSYRSSRYTNWELSTERASAARKELETVGLSPDSLALVAGYAATKPLIRDNPNDPRNRRISIIIQYPETAGDKPGAEGEAGAAEKTDAAGKTGAAEKVSASPPTPVPRS